MSRFPRCEEWKAVFENVRSFVRPLAVSVAAAATSTGTRLHLLSTALFHSSHACARTESLRVWWCVYVCVCMCMYIHVCVCVCLVLVSLYVHGQVLCVYVVTSPPALVCVCVCVYRMASTDADAKAGARSAAASSGPHDGAAAPSLPSAHSRWGDASPHRRTAHSTATSVASGHGGAASPMGASSSGSAIPARLHSRAGVVEDLIASGRFVEAVADLNWMADQFQALNLPAAGVTVYATLAGADRGWVAHVCF